MNINIEIPHIHIHSRLLGKTIKVDFKVARIVGFGMEMDKEGFVLIVHTEGDFIAYFPWTDATQHGGYREKDGDPIKNVYLESTIID